VVVDSSRVLPLSRPFPRLFLHKRAALFHSEVTSSETENAKYRGAPDIAHHVKKALRGCRRVLQALARYNAALRTRLQRKTGDVL